MALVALQRWRELLQRLRTINSEKIICRVFDTNSDMKVHAFSSTMQISYLYASHFPFKIITAAKSRQTGRKNKKQSKAEIDYMIKHCSEGPTNELDTREESFLAETLFISQKLTRTTSTRESYSSLKNSPLPIAAEEKTPPKSCQFT